jgi:hypothetical protein
VLNIDDVARQQGVVSSDIVRMLLALDGRLALMIEPQTKDNIFAAWQGFITRALDRARKGYAMGDSSEIDALLDGSLRIYNIIILTPAAITGTLRRRQA